VPTGTVPIDQTDLDRETIHKIKQALGIEPDAWVGIGPDGEIITTGGDGEAQVQGNIKDFAPRLVEGAHPRNAEGSREFAWEGPAQHGKLLSETRFRQVPEIEPDWVPRGEKGRVRGVPLVPGPWWYPLYGYAVRPTAVGPQGGHARARPKTEVESANTQVEQTHESEREFATADSAIGQTSASNQ
jgi:hypothetical protein